MDPNAAILLLIDAIRESDHEATEEHADNLAAWIEKGGFPPSPASLASHLHALAWKSSVELEAAADMEKALEQRHAAETRPTKH
jgi:hypothetical protein